MKIVEPGKKRNTYEATCSSCGCRFIFLLKESKEVKNEAVSAFGVYLKIQRIINCPQCGKEVDVSELKESRYDYDTFIDNYDR